MEVNMKHLIRSTAALLLGCVFLLTASSAWGVKPIDYERGPFHFGPWPFFDCTQFEDMDFFIWVAYTELEIGKIMLNKDGTWKHTIGTTFTTDAALWIPEDEGCKTGNWTACVDPFTPMEGKVATLDDFNGAPEHRTVIYRDWIFVDPDLIPENGDEFWWPTWGRESGIFFRIVVPEYGALIMKAGTKTMQISRLPEPGENEEDVGMIAWEVIKVTPNVLGPDNEETYAVCEYMNDK